MYFKHQQGTSLLVGRLTQTQSFFFFVAFFFVVVVVVFFVFFKLLVEHIFTALQIYITVNFSVVALVDLVLSGCRF